MNFVYWWLAVQQIIPNLRTYHLILVIASISSNSKFRLRQTGNFDIPTGNFEFKLEISTSANWKFRTGNFDFFKLEISTFQLAISSSNWKFPLCPTGNFEFELEISTSQPLISVRIIVPFFHMASSPVTISHQLILDIYIV